MDDIKRKRKFYLEAVTSVVTYLLVNTFLVFLNWATSPYYWWVLWVIAGWGLGLGLKLVKGYLKYKMDIEE
ncbi:2TM domain-containing protein [Bacteroides sp. OttesenSCG-928-F21]|nr:2TM domain-containing protein [Bacteroides sp. OttesenSCG-928-F21]